MDAEVLPESPVLVTGANGFIGSALCKALVESGCEVRALILEGTDPGVLLQLGVKIIEGDVCKTQSLPPAFEKVRTVYHLAALAVDWAPWESFMSINAGGTWNVIEAARDSGVSRFVLMSSLVVHPFVGYRNADENTQLGNRSNGYCMSKIVAEVMTREAKRHNWFQTSIVRPGAIIFGPGDTTAFVHVAPALEKGMMPLVGNGGAVTCYSYVDNLIDGLLLVGGSDKAAGQTFNINDDAMISWRDYLSATSRALGVKTRFLSIPTGLATYAAWFMEKAWKAARHKNAPIVHRYRVGMVAKDFHFSCEKAKRELGYKPKVGLEAGLRNTVEWYRQWQAENGQVRS